MPLLPPNQQRQSTEGISQHIRKTKINTARSIFSAVNLVYICRQLNIHLFIFVLYRNSRFKCVKLAQAVYCVVFSFGHSRAGWVQCHEGTIYAHRRWISCSLLSDRSPVICQCKELLHPSVASERSVSSSTLKLHCTHWQFLLNCVTQTILTASFEAICSRIVFWH